MTTTAGCPSPIDLERAHDEREELEHVATCTSCSATWRELDELRQAIGDLPDVRPDQLQVRRVRGRVLHAEDQRSEQARRGRSLGRTLSYGLVAVAAVAATSVFWLGHGESTAPRASQAIVLPPAPPAPAPRVAVVKEGDKLHLTITTGDTEFEVHGVMVASVDRELRVHVTRGQVELQPSNQTARTLGPEQQWTSLADPVPAARDHDAPTVPAPAPTVTAPITPAAPEAPPRTSAATARRPPAAVPPETIAREPSASQPAEVSVRADATPVPPTAPPVAPPSGAATAIGREAPSPGSSSTAAPTTGVAAAKLPPTADATRATVTSAPGRPPEAARAQDKLAQPRDRVERKADEVERKQDRAERKEDRAERKEDRAERRRERAERREDRRTLRGR